jgi:nicotinate-nucleotide pyrophosphorylase (carboxylating)
MTKEIQLPDLDVNQIQPLVRLAVQEDMGAGDITSLSVVPRKAQTRGTYVVKHHGVIAGLPVLPLVFGAIDPSVEFRPLVEEGSKVEADTPVAEVKGSAVSILSGERISLNFLQRLSGIATLASRYAAAIKGVDVKVLDTRKTTPGWRYLEKYAVRAGGAHNHRMGLYDQVLIKDNHLELSGHQPIKDAVKKARGNCPQGTVVEVEVESLDHVEAALAAGADIIMLDNMSLEQIAEGVKIIRDHSEDPPIIEASGNVTLETVRSIAQTGVDWVSAGELTHSARSLDITLALESI